MSKVLTDKEALDIIRRAIEENEIDDADQYEYFMEGLGKLIAEHFGGEFVTVSTPLLDEKDDTDSSSDRYCLHFEWNECVPDGGGVYKDYDTDVPIEEWKEDVLCQKHSTP